MLNGLPVDRLKPSPGPRGCLDTTRGASTRKQLTMTEPSTTQSDELATTLMGAFERAMASRGGQHWENVADAVLAKYILIPRTELPKVTLSDYGNGLCTALAQENFQPLLRREARDEGPAFNWRIALANLAVAEAIEMRDKAQTETKLQERRDALTQEFSTYPYRYDNVSPTARKAIDRIIQLEDAAVATR